MIHVSIGNPVEIAIEALVLAHDVARGFEERAEGLGGSGLGGGGFGHQSKNHIAVRACLCFILAGGFVGRKPCIAFVFYSGVAARSRFGLKSST